MIETIGSHQRNDRASGCKNEIPKINIEMDKAEIGNEQSYTNQDGEDHLAVFALVHKTHNTNVLKNDCQNKKSIGKNDRDQINGVESAKGNQKKTDRQ